MPNDNYVLDNKIGNGAFGIVYKAHHRITKECCAIKIGESDQIGYEAQIMKCLSGHVNIPCLKWCGMVQSHKVIVTDLYSLSLKEIKSIDIQKYLKKYLIQMIDVIEYLHVKGFVHRDIKPDNFMVKSTTLERIYLIDYGMTKKYANYNASHGFTGSLLFASINAHKQLPYARRDDLESIIYTTLFLLCNTLSWANITSDNMMHDKIIERKSAIATSTMVPYDKDIFDSVIKLHSYVRRLAMRESPSYTFMKSILSKLT